MNLKSQEAIDNFKENKNTITDRIAKRKFRVFCTDSDGKWRFLSKVPHVYYSLMRPAIGKHGIIIENYEEPLSEKDLFDRMLKGDIKEVE